MRKLFLIIIMLMFIGCGIDTSVHKKEIMAFSRGIELKNSMWRFTGHENENGSLEFIWKTSIFNNSKKEIKIFSLCFYFIDNVGLELKKDMGTDYERFARDYRPLKPGESIDIKRESEINKEKAKLIKDFIFKIKKK